MRARTSESSAEPNPSFSGTALFLGAGASDFAGYQTFRTFGDLMLDPLLRYRKGLPSLSPETPNLIREIHEALKNMGRPTTHDNYLWLLTNYRDFCTKFATHGGLLRRFPRISDEIRSFDDTMAVATMDITRTTYLHYSSSQSIPPTGAEVVTLYEDLARRNNPRKPFLPIFTTNYDLLLEDLFSSSRSLRSLPLVNGIPGVITENQQWTRAEYASQYGIHLYRIHGCAGWFYPYPGNPNLLFSRTNSASDEALSNLCVMFPGREIYPGNDPHGFGFRKFYETLLTCGTLLVIGFSFRDDDIMHLLLAANAARPRALRLCVVDPVITPEEVLHNLRDAATRSPFPVKEPEPLSCLECQFGQPGVGRLIVDFVEDRKESCHAAARSGVSA